MSETKWPVEQVDMNGIEELIKEIKEKFQDWGIIPKLNYVVEEVTIITPGEDVPDVNSPFIIAGGNSPFYFDINSKADAEDLYKLVTEGLEELMEKLDGFINSNALDEESSKKLKGYKTAIMRIEKVIRAKKKNLEKKLADCVEVKELRKEVRVYYMEYLEKFIKDCLHPIYFELKHVPENKATCLWLIKEFNVFLESLGASTMNVCIGAVFDYDLPFEPVAITPELITHDENLKDCVKAVEKLAYVFAEPDGNRPICSGTVAIWRYEK